MRYALSLAILAAAAVLCGVVFAQNGKGQRPAYQVIVNPRNPSAALDRKFLEEAFLKRITIWPDGEGIRPADLAPESPVRRAFTHDVLNRSVEAVKGYWQQRIFSGRDVPPPEFAHDDDVVQYVLKHEGGIGYVAGDANVGECHVVVVQ
jgi:ABC-type phosphate transport system substrate-binding protein